MNKLLSHVLTPPSPIEQPAIQNFRKIKYLPEKLSPEKSVYQPIKQERMNKRSRRNLMNHNQFSVANLQMKESFDKIMKNQKKFEFYLKNSRSRWTKPGKRRYKILDINTKIEENMHNQPEIQNSWKKSKDKIFIRRATVNSRTKLNEMSVSRIDFLSESPQ